jgi:hypothetical protein
MNISLPWIKRRGATLEELQQQVQAARAAYKEVQIMVIVAQVAFDDDPSTEKALIAARAIEQSAREHVGRADRLLAQAEESDRAAKRAELERRRDEISAQLGPAELERLRGPGRDAEVAALINAINTRVARYEVERQILAIGRELDAVCEQLGEPRAARSSHYLDDMPSKVDVHEALLAHSRTAKGFGADARKALSAMLDYVRAA